jgi:hypothetical protein
VCTDDGIDRTGISAMSAADTQRFINNGDGGRDGLRQRYDFPAEQIGKPTYRVLAARRAKVNSRVAIHKGGRERSTTGKAALSTLGLRKQVIDLFHQIVGT